METQGERTKIERGSLSEEGGEPKEDEAGRGKEK